MRGGVQPRLLCVVIVLSVVLSGFLAASSAADPSDASASPAADPAAPGTQALPTDRALPKAAPKAASIDREGLRVWSERLGLPKATLAYIPDDRSGLVYEVGGGSAITPDDADEVAIHQADAAHALGFDGTDVRVAVIDTGIDFVHPDLFNVSFRDPDPLSPYYLHPVAYDGGSLNDYLIFGSPGPESWWVDTSYSTTVATGPNATAFVLWTDGMTNLTWNVTGVSGLSPGEEARVGFHSDDRLLALFGNRSGLLLFNHAGAGPPYDHVLVDLDQDMSFVGEKHNWINTDWATFDPAAELISRDLDSDGTADLSGGMLTFISDGVREIPYARRQIDVLNLFFRAAFNDDTFDLWSALGVDPYLNLLPAAGDLVMIFGDLDGPGSGGSHGTWVTSAIAGQGLTGGGSGGPVLGGMAPGTKIIGSGNNFGTTDPLGQVGLYTALVFATEGYDALVASGDEAHIASNSWGGADWTGWDWSSRWADWVSTFHAAGETSFVFAAGNSGPGYGGRSGPAGGRGIIVSGSMENFNYRVDPWFSIDGGPNPAWGDVTGFSIRGPSAVGHNLVDALATGHFGYGADPLNQNPFDTDSGTALNGNSSWNLWSGTSLSTPNLSGILALAFDAYLAAHGTHPDAWNAKLLLRGGADDAHVDPFLAGAGTANALRSVLLANETNGISLSTDAWYPGNVAGTTAPGYAAVLYPGDFEAATFDVVSHRGALPTGVTVEDAGMVQTGSISYGFSKPVGSSREYLLTAAGLRSTAGSLLVPDSGGLYATADAVRISLRFPRDRMSESPYWLLDVYDWTDVNLNGSYQGSSERNLMFRDLVAYPGLFGPVGHAWISEPAVRAHDGLVVRLGVQFDGGLLGPVPVTLQVDYFERTDEPWITVFTPGLVVPAGGSAPVSLGVTVPADADPGLYEAVVLFRSDDGTVVTLPVVINVAIPGIPGSFGGNAYDRGGYRQGAALGAAFADDAGSGDYRYYFFELPAPETLTVSVTWDDQDSWTELYVLTGMPDWFAGQEPLWFGPDTLATAGATTGAGTSASVTADLNAGLNLVVVRSNAVSGLTLEEHPVGQMGSILVDPSPWTGAGVDVDGFVGIDILSDIDFPDVVVTAFGFSPAMDYAGRPIETGQDDAYPLAIEAGGRLAATLLGSAGDIDLRVYWYDPGAGDYVQVASSTTPSASEAVDLLLPADGDWLVVVEGFSVPANTTYDLRIWAPQGLVDMEAVVVPPTITAGVPEFILVRYSLPHFPQTFDSAIFIGTSSNPFLVRVDAELVPDLPPEFLEMGPAPGSLVSDPTPLVSARFRDAADAYETAVDGSTVRVWVDGVDMTGAASVNLTHVSLAVPFVLADGSHQVTMTAADLNGNRNTTSWSFTLDSTPPSLVITSPTFALTASANVTVAGTTDPAATLDVNGIPVPVDANGSFSTSLSLAEGLNLIVVNASDAAGNAASVTKSVTLDTTPPALAVTTPSDNAVLGTSAVAVSGTAEVGADLTVNGVRVLVSPGGTWSVGLALADGMRTIVATATDAAGNVRSVTRVVFVDTVAPTVTLTAPTSPTSASRTVTVSGVVSEPTAVVLVNALPASVNPTTGVFSVPVTFPADGTYAIVVSATDAAFNTGTAITGVLVDATAPVVAVSLPLDGTQTGQPTIVVSGTTDDPTATVLVNGIRVRPASNGAWSVVVALDLGTNVIVVSAVDDLGNMATTVTRTVAYSSPVPAIEDDLADNTQAINNLGGSTTLGLVAVFAVLAALQFVFYWNLRKKMETMGSRTPEEPAEEKGGT